MNMYIAYAFNTEDGSYFGDFVIKANSRKSAWDKALQMIFSESLFSIGKMVVLHSVEDPF